MQEYANVYNSMQWLYINMQKWISSNTICTYHTRLNPSDPSWNSSSQHCEGHSAPVSLASMSLVWSVISTLVGSQNSASPCLWSLHTLEYTIVHIRLCKIYSLYACIGPTTVFETPSPQPFPQPSPQPVPQPFPQPSPQPVPQPVPQPSPQT